MFSSVVVGLSLWATPLSPGDVFPPIPLPPQPPSVQVHPHSPPPARVGYVWPHLHSPYNTVYHGPFAPPPFGALPHTIPPTGGSGLPQPKEKTLYDRLGGEAAIRAVVEDFVARAAADPKLNFTRKGTPAEWTPTPDNLVKLHKNLVDYFGMLTGGPQKYAGKSMTDAHKGMRITRAEFDASLAALKASLDQLKVPAAEQAELLNLVEKTAADVVDKPKN